MIAQDTGSAIVGPARADLYFGAGAEAGQVSGRMRNNARFVILVPNSLDPVAKGRTMPLPDPRPSQKIAKLFSQQTPAKEKDAAKPTEAVVASKEAGTANAAAKPTIATAPVAQATDPAKAVPLPEARPAIASRRSPHRWHRHVRHHRRWR
jgi:membrane-bound lytic murein transglycosylase A